MVRPCPAPFSPCSIISLSSALTSLDIRYSVIELCRPVGGLFPKLQSTCKPGDGGNGTLGTGVVTSGLPPKPTATGESVTPPFTGEATRVGLTFSVEKVLVLLLVGIVGLDMLVV